MKTMVKRGLIVATLLCAGSVSASVRNLVDDLAAAERSVATLHAAYVQAFLEITEKAKIQDDQARWLSTLDGCKKTLPCLIRMNKVRHTLLAGKSAAMPYAGFFLGVGGDLVLYPLESEYVAQIRTMEVPAARWTCQVSGLFKKVGKHLRFSINDSAKTLNVWTVGSQKFEIRANERATAIARDYCGRNGSFSGVFKRDA
jgi:hypothetical protein